MNIAFVAYLTVFQLFLKDGEYGRFERVKRCFWEIRGLYFDMKLFEMQIFVKFELSLKFLIFRD